MGFDYKEVDLFAKDAFFTETYKAALNFDGESNPKVPILIDGNVILNESELICYYIIDKF